MLIREFRSLFVAALVFVSASALVSCGESSTKEEAPPTDPVEKVDMSGPEYTSAYVCPMHCEGSGSDQPGKCPVCGMDYVPRTEAEVQ